MKQEEKVFLFLTALQDAYRQPDERQMDNLKTLKLSNETLTDDFTAILQALFIFHADITGSDIDIIGFTHLLNRLAIQYVSSDDDKE